MLSRRILQYEAGNDGEKPVIQLPAGVIFSPPPPLILTGVCKNETIATNRPRHPWIPAYAGMTEWAR